MVPGEGEVFVHVAAGAVAVALVEAQVEPADEHARHELRRVGALEDADQPQQQRQQRQAQRHVPIGQLAQRRPRHDVVRHLRKTDNTTMTKRPGLDFANTPPAPFLFIHSGQKGGKGWLNLS